MSKNSYTSNEIKAFLLKRYGPPAHAFFTEVADSTGMYGSRYADALSMSLWPSHGFTLQGFEIKVSRSDFLKELKQPEKANAIMQYCDHWWIVCPKGIALADEIPQPWGLMEIVGGRFFVKKKAPQLAPVEWTKGFIAAMLRRATENTVPRSTLTTLRLEMREEVEKSVQGKVEYEKGCSEGLRQKIKDFEEASGMNLSSWKHTPKQLGEAVMKILDGRFRSFDVDYPISLLNEALVKLKAYNEITKQFNNEWPQK